MKNGIDADITSMTQAEKAMLRYQYVMAQSSHVMSDFARTSDTYHNTLTRLKANFMTLKGTIGTSLMNLFKPVLVVVNNAIVVINKFAKAVGDSLGKILGWRYEVGSGAIEMSDAADYADDVASGLGNAGQAAKDLKKQLQGFDELNNLTLNDDNGGGGGSGGGSGGLGSGGAGDLAGQWVKEDSLFESDWDTWYKLGKGISEAWTEGLNSIDWDSVYSAFDNFGKGLAEFLNGLINPELFGALGRTIAGALNSALHFLNSFGTTFDWTNFGESIASGINNFLETFDFVLAARTINAWSKGILDSAITAVQKVEWDKVGKSITDFFSELDIGDIASKLSTLAISIAQGLGTALSNTDWTLVGKKIGEALNGLDLTRIVFNLANLAFQILEALGKALIGIGEENPLAAAIIGVILGIKFLNKLSGIGTAILNAIGVDVASGSTTSLGSSLFNKINDSTKNYFGTNALTVAVSVVVAWELGESIGKQLGEAIWEDVTGEDMSEYFDNFTWSNFFGELYEGIKDNVLLEAWNNMWSDFAEHVADYLAPVSAKIKSVLRDLPGGQWIADALGIDLTLTKEELQDVIDTYDKMYEATGAGIYKSAADDARKKLQEEYGSQTHTSSSGEEHGGSSGKFGMGFWDQFTVTPSDDFKTKLQNAWNEFSAIWKDDQAEFSIDPNATSDQTIEDAHTEKKSFWKSALAAFKINPAATSENTIKTEYGKREGTWLSKKVGFTIDSVKSAVGTIKNNYTTRSNLWKDKASQFTVSSGVTSTSDIISARNTRQNLWTNKAALFTVSSGVTSTSDIVSARNTRQNLWTNKTSSFYVNSNATSKNTVQSSYNSISGVWKDKDASFGINFTASASGVKEWINSNVFKKINNTFANIPVLKNFSIPYMATGGIVDGATLSIIGESGAEAVVPLERNTQWLSKMAKMLGSELEYTGYTPSSTSYKGSVTTPSFLSSANENKEQIAEQNALLREQNRLLQQIAQKELTISEREVFNATRNASNNYYNRTGNSPFVF